MATLQPTMKLMIVCVAKELDYVNSQNTKDDFKGNISRNTIHFLDIDCSIFVLIW